MVLAPLLARPIRRGKEKLVYDGLIIFFIDRRRQMDRQSLCSVRLGQYALTVDSYFGDLRIYSVRGRCCGRRGNRVSDVQTSVNPSWLELNVMRLGFGLWSPWLGVNQASGPPNLQIVIHSFIHSFIHLDLSICIFKYLFGEIYIAPHQETYSEALDG